MNNATFVYNYISESNNAKVIHCTSQTDRCNSSNILNNKLKVSKNNEIIINIIYNIEYMVIIFKCTARNNHRYF